jgi:hypothetical protein
VSCRSVSRAFGAAAPSATACASYSLTIGSGGSASGCGRSYAVPVLFLPLDPATLRNATMVRLEMTAQVSGPIA